MAWLRNKKTGGWFEIPDDKLDTNKYMNSFIRQNGGLTKKDKEITAGYAANESSYAINDLLRQDKDISQYKQTIDKLDNNMEKVTKPLTVYRTVNDGFLKNSTFIKDGRQFELDPQMTYEQIKQALSGAQFVDKAYMSTSYQEPISHGNILMRINAKGSKALLTSNDDEREIILGRNQKWKITNFKRENENDSWSRYIIDIEYNK